MKQKSSNAESVSALPGGHLDESDGWEQRLDSALRDGWKRYRAAFKLARRRLSEEAVHQLRVETRRVLSLLNLVEPLVGRRIVSPACRQFKRTLKSFARLRDAQVQLRALTHEHRRRPHARALGQVLRKREEKLTRHSRRRFHKITPGALKEVFVPVRKATQARWRRETGDPRMLAPVIGAVDEAFTETQERLRDIDLADLATFHRLRVAFKRFRYMLEALQEILPGRFADHRRAMRAIQTRLGEVQDARLLLEGLEKLRGRARLNAGAVEEIRKELTRRQQRAIGEFVRLKNPLRNLWPPRGGIAKLLPTNNAGIRS